jgi:hypothetical protein
LRGGITNHNDHHFSYRILAAGEAAAQHQRKVDPFVDATTEDVSAIEVQEENVEGT